MKKAIALISVALGLVLIVGFFWWINGEENLEDRAVRGTVITYRDSGFSPPVLSAASGSQITIENNSSQDLEFVSNPHPTHADNPQLNTDTIKPGQSTTIAVTSKGTWGYHNHLSPNNKGTIIVE